MSLLAAMLLSTGVGLLLLMGSELGETRSPKSKKLVSGSVHADMFPTPEFDESAPMCVPLREPCGFYSFSIGMSTPLKWLKSWCRCDDDHECVYERTDTKMRVYIQMCVSREHIRDLRMVAVAAATAAADERQEERETIATSAEREQPESSSPSSSSSSSSASQLQTPPQQQQQQQQQTTAQY